MSKVENQNTEFKESWRDDYLKVICAFANSLGGQLYIGMSDKATVVGLIDTKKLLEDIPSKTKELLGIIVDVNLKGNRRGEYIVIKVPACNHPVTYRGKYYLRSGSTTQELNGTELQRFLLKKSGTSWEAIIENDVQFEDLNITTIEKYRSLIGGKSDAKLITIASAKQLLKKLHLQTQKGLTRAALLLFASEPQKFFPAAIVKIGRFDSNDVLLSTDEIRGNLFEQAEQAMEILQKKYLSAQIKIEGLYRSSDLEYPEPALREAIINAIAHKDYMGAHIQIKVYPDKLVFWNPGELPKDLTIAQLRKAHPSHPRNKIIADVLYKAGLIEAWGSGTMRMIKECREAHLPEPQFEENFGGMSVIFSKDVYDKEFISKIGLNERQVKAVFYLKENGVINNKTYQELTGAIKRTVSRDLNELIEKKIIVRSGVTGKGTTYSLYGITARKNKSQVPQAANDKLEEKLSELDKKLKIFDPDEEIRMQFNKDTFKKVFDTWFTDLVLEFVPVIQKFNKYFINPRHSINMPMGFGGFVFENQNVKEVINHLKDQVANSSERINQYDASITIHTTYGSFKKAGFDTFGCNYALEIKFLQDWYELKMDDVVMVRNNNLQFKRQYHKPLTKSEIKGLSDKFAEVIYTHINSAIDKIAQAKGVKKGTKGS